MDKNTDLKGLKHSKCAASAVLSDRSIAEQIYDPDSKTVGFAVWKNDDVSVVSAVETSPGLTVRPYGIDNNLLENSVVLFPSGVAEYGEESDLLDDIRRYLRRYVDLDPVFLEIACHYVLLSWVYDRFNELPYLRVRGDYGSGKTRFLVTVGSICYRPIFASGASTVAPLFHILDRMGGTLIVDEADFRFSDETADIAKILNNGNTRGFPVLRCEKASNQEIRPRSYAVFGPKLVASRHSYADVALESRFITEDMGMRPVRKNIPIALPDRQREEAQQLRNKLLLYRFRTFSTHRAHEILADRTLDLRANQSLIPLLSVTKDPVLRDQILERARIVSQQAQIDRSMTIEAHVLGAIRSLHAEKDEPVTISALTKEVIKTFGENADRRITPKWIGYIVRSRLHLTTRKTRGVYIVAEGQQVTLDYLAAKFGI